MDQTNYENQKAARQQRIVELEKLIGLLEKRHDKTLPDQKAGIRKRIEGVEDELMDLIQSEPLAAPDLTGASASAST